MLSILKKLLGQLLKILNIANWSNGSKKNIIIAINKIKIRWINNNLYAN
jgi:hypothetical protein